MLFMADKKCKTGRTAQSSAGLMDVVLVEPPRIEPRLCRGQTTVVLYPLASNWLIL